jgi:iron complex transport system substrate-binding protein
MGKMTMNALRKKVIASISIAIIALAVLPVVGVTTAVADTSQGVMIDFGYWDVAWVEMSFTEGMDGNGALDAACSMKGYAVIRLADGTVYSVNGQENLVSVKWGMYVQDNGSWASADPDKVKATDNRILCWARASDAGTVVPGSDESGSGYYGYADGGVCDRTDRPIKVVTLAPSATEMVCSVGGLDYLVGTDSYSNYPKEYVEKRESGGITVIGGYTDPNYEWIVRLDPDLVFCDGGTGEQTGLADKLRKSGIDCVVLYGSTDMETLYNNIWIVASAMGLSENANDAIQSLRLTVDAVAGIAGRTDARMFISLSADPSPWTAGSGTFIADVMDCAGAVNVFSAQSSSWFMVSKEQIFAKQPRAMIIISAAEVTTEDQYESIVGSLDPVWKETPAYREGRIYIFSGTAGDMLSRPGPRLAEAVELIAKIANPEAFSDIDPLDVIPNYFGDDYTSYLKYQKVAA